MYFGSDVKCAFFSSDSSEIKDPKQNIDIQEELKSITNTHTWDLVHLSPNKSSIGCKWIFKINLFVNGTIERYKACNRTHGLDYLEIFCIVIKMTTIRLLLSIASSLNWNLHQLNINTAFLHGDLIEDVYMKCPSGLNTPKHMVCKLNKSIYDLKQGTRQWNKKLMPTLYNLCFNQSKSDYYLFTKKFNNHFTIIFVYVDDLILVGNEITEINNVKSILDTKFSLKDLGNLKYFLGFEIARSSKGITLCQRRYNVNLLQEFGILVAKPTSTPMDS